MKRILFSAAIAALLAGCAGQPEWATQLDRMCDSSVPVKPSIMECVNFAKEWRSDAGESLDDKERAEFVPVCWKQKMDEHDLALGKARRCIEAKQRALDSIAWTFAPRPHMYCDSFALGNSIHTSCF